MVYTPLTWSYGEIPASSKMQQLADNDAAFNDGTGILTFNNGGWQQVDDAWSYASVSGIFGTITVPSDATAKYEVGDRIKFTQTTVKYGVITAVTSTSITFTGGTNYTLVNAAISSIYFSKWDAPLGFPGSFNYTPTFTGYSSNPTGSQVRFSIHGKMVHYRFEIGSGGTSNATTKTITAPITPKYSYTYLQTFTLDNGAQKTALGRLGSVAGNAALVAFLTAAGDPWTASGTAQYCFDIWYQGNF